MFGFASLVLVLAASAFSTGCFSCNVKQDPDALRQKTASTTAALKSDAKAVGQGVAEGLKRDRQLDLNSASADQLASLPGITPALADRIVRSRPYDNPHQLVTKRLLSEAEYGRIADRVTVKK
jgi:DNA uptake protein ComE-like DNA-binding protein